MIGFSNTMFASLFISCGHDTFGFCAWISRKARNPSTITARTIPTTAPIPTTVTIPTTAIVADFFLCVYVNVFSRRHCSRSWAHKVTLSSCRNRSSTVSDSTDTVSLRVYRRLVCNRRHVCRIVWLGVHAQHPAWRLRHHRKCDVQSANDHIRSAIGRVGPTS